MTTITVPAEEVDVTPPAHPDGEAGWLYLVMWPSGDLLYSDNLGEIVVASIQDDRYQDFLDDESDEAHDACLVMRYEELCDLGSKVQAYLVEEGVEQRGALDLNTVGEDVLTALFSDRHVPFAGVWRDGATSYEWTEDVPLVAIATDYAPFTSRPAPTGRVVMLDPSSEMGYCLSLAALGLFEFFTKAVVAVGG
jgi:hypothetical protein